MVHATTLIRTDKFRLSRLHIPTLLDSRTILHIEIVRQHEHVAENIFKQKKKNEES